MAIERVCRTLNVKLPEGRREEFMSSSGYFNYMIDNMGTLFITGRDFTTKIVSEDAYRVNEWTGIKAHFGDLKLHPAQPEAPDGG